MGHKLVCRDLRNNALSTIQDGLSAKAAIALLKKVTQGSSQDDLLVYWVEKS